MMHGLRGYAFLFILVLARSAEGAGGTLDPSFGSGGRATPSAGEATALAIYPDGRLLLGGGVNNFALTRLLPDGTPDASFGGDGSVSVSGEGERGLSDLVILPDERIIAVGYAEDQLDFRMRLIRFNPDGSIDASYASGGRATADFPAGAVSGRAALQPDGRLLNVASQKPGGNETYALALARFNDDGSLDASFGSGGQVVTDFPGSSEYASDVILAPSGQFYVVGVITTPTTTGGLDNDWLIVRYQADGSIDPAYGSGGRVTTSFYGEYAAYENAAGGALLPDGNLVVGGGSGGHIALARYNTDGMLDISFGTWGKVVVPHMPEMEVRGMVRRADGSLVVAGTGYRSPVGVFAPRGFGLMAFDADGAVDTSFAACPQVSTNFASAASLRTMGLQPDGKVVLVGGLASGVGAVARYGTPSTPACQPAAPGRSSLAIRDDGADAKDRLKWKWSGAPVAPGDLGDPTATTGYTFCVLDQSGGEATLRLGSPLLRAHWSATAGGAAFRAKSENRFPFTAAKLKATPSSRGKLKLIGKGEDLQPSLPLALPATARLVRDDNGECWEATYSTAPVNDGSAFSARSD